MPRLSVWLIRAALMHLLLGFALGALLLTAKTAPLGLAAGSLVRAHRDTILFGWMAQCTLGVAYWILPKRAGGPMRGALWPVVLGGVLFNAGLLVAVGSALLSVDTGGGDYATLVVAAGLLVAALLPRVKPFGAP